MHTHNLAVIGVREDGSRKTLVDGLTQKQADQIAALVDGTFSRIVIEAVEPSGVNREPPSEEGSLPWSE